MKKIRVEDIDCLNFWINYFGCCYPNGYDELNDISVSELLLLLPLAIIGEEDIQSVREKITEQMKNYFPENLSESVSRCIAAGLA